MISLAKNSIKVDRVPAVAEFTLKLLSFSERTTKSEIVDTDSPVTT